MGRKKNTSSEARETLESPAGRGTIYEKGGSVLFEADYSFNVFKVSHGIEIFGILDRRSDGRQGWADLFTGKQLTLRLADGRYLDFYVRSGAGAMMSNEHFYTPGHQETGSISAEEP